MRGYLICVLFLYLPVTLSADRVPIKLEKVSVNVSDEARILRGAKFYANHCMVCHTMKYLEHNKIAEKAGVTLDKMPLKDQEWWLGVVPPDLTLITTQRGADWVFTYLQSFYIDAERPTGFNNLLVRNSNMTNILAAYQGQQVLTAQGQYALSHPDVAKTIPYYTALRLDKSGAMSPEQFHQALTDLVSFLVYASDPKKSQRLHIGVWVMLFLGMLLVLVYLLKRLYWKNIK